MMTYAFWIFTAFLIIHAIFIDTHRSIVYIASWIITVGMLKMGWLFYITGCN